MGSAEEGNPLTPELQPVRRRGRLGIDRGLVVAIVVVSLLAVGVWKPWAATTDSAVVPAADADGHISAPELTGSPAPEPAVATPWPETLSLEGVAATLADIPRDGDTAWVLSAMRPEPVSAPYLYAAPATTDLGSNCAEGVLLGEGTAAIGLTLPQPSRPSRVTRVLLRRLFDGQPPVSVPVTSAHDDASGVVLVAAAGEEWPPGHYALTLDVMGRAGMVAFCVGRMFRLVDYSLITFVPSNADSPAARKALIADIDHP
jgi:hypothetical protein